MAGKLRKLVRKIGGGMKKAIRTLAKPFKKVMGFMGRLGWVGTLAMMIAMPYISGFWGSITEGISAGIGGAAADTATQAAMQEASKQAIVKATAEGVSQEAIKQAGITAGQEAAKKAATTVGEKIGSRFISETGKATGLFAKGPMAKALGYTLKSMQVGISGIGKVYSSLTDLVTAGVDFIAQPLMKEGMSFTDSMSNWIGDRFNEARNAMGLETTKGWSPKTVAEADANKTDFTGDSANVVTTTKRDVTVADTKKDISILSQGREVTSEDLLGAFGEQAGVGPFGGGDDYLSRQRSVWDTSSQIDRQLRGETVYTGTTELKKNILDPTDLAIDAGSAVADVVDVALDDKWYPGKHIKEGWQGTYEQVPNYVATGPDDKRAYLDALGEPLPIGYKQEGYKTVFNPGLKSKLTPKNIVREGGEYVVGSVEDYLDPQRVIQDKIDETIGLKRDQQATIVQEYNAPNTLIDMPEGFARLPDLPGMDYLSIANHANNINNGDYFASPYNYKEQEPYALPGYFG